VKNPTDIAIYNKTGKFNQKTEIKIIKPARAQYDNMENTFFSRRLNETNKAQKVLNIQYHLEKFKHFQKDVKKQQEHDKVHRLRKNEQDK